MSLGCIETVFKATSHGRKSYQGFTAQIGSTMADIWITSTSRLLARMGGGSRYYDVLAGSHVSKKGRLPRRRVLLSWTLFFLIRSA